MNVSLIKSIIKYRVIPFAYTLPNRTIYLEVSLDGKPFRILNYYAVQTQKLSTAANWYVAQRLIQKENLWSEVIAEATYCSENSIPLLILGDMQENSQDIHIRQLLKLGFKEKAAYGIGAVGKDMVYMLSASYILYYYQNIMGVSDWVMGIILMIARVFDAFNDPLMGVIVAKTKTKWGKFRPWLFIGTLTNALVLGAMFAAPPALSGKGLAAYAAATYILWGVTYTMMDIPYWSMVPACNECTRPYLCRCRFRTGYRIYHDGSCGTRYFRTRQESQHGFQ